MDHRAVGDVLFELAPAGVACATVPIGPTGHSSAVVGIEADAGQGGPVRSEEHRAGREAAELVLGPLAAGGRLPLGNDPDGVPRWPSHVVGSISHTSGCAAAVAALSTDCVGVGVDVEATMELGAHLHRVVASEEELRSCGRRLGVEPAVGAALLFSAKEAVFKAHFPLRRGRYEFTEIALRPADGPAAGNREWIARGAVLGADEVRVAAQVSSALDGVVALAWW